MSKYIYEVCISTGRRHPKHSKFLDNVDSLGAKAVDYGGIDRMCVIGHHLDRKTIHRLCSAGIQKKSDVTVEEITRETLDDPDSHHKIHDDIVNKYFLPYGSYPNIS